MKQRRLFTVVFLCLLTITAIMAPPVLAQGDSSQEFGQIDSGGKSVNDKEGSGLSWWIFHAIWFSALLALYFLLSYNKDKKLKVKVNGEKAQDEKSDKDEKEDKDEKKEIFSKRRLGFLAIFLLAVIAVSELILVANGFLTIAVIIFLATGTIIFSRWPRVLELWRALTSADVTSHLVVGEKTTFKDVGGLKEAVEELKEVVELYKDPKEAEAWGIRPARGILFFGPPGCGKTLLARATAGEADMNFLEFSGAGIGTSYIRSGAQDIIDLFQKAQAMSPCVIFFDEIDALGKKRGYDTSGEYDHTLTELLHQLDGIKRKSGVLLLAATNREDVLDEALLRPGRFDKKILIPHPDIGAREEILKIHVPANLIGPDVCLKDVARKTPGFSGVDLEQLKNEAAQLARRRYKENLNIIARAVESVKEKILGETERVIAKIDFEEGMLRVIMGPARKLIMSEEERRTVARHEIGHAVVTAELGLEVLDKVMLIPRNWALGMTISHSEESQMFSREMILGKIASLYGGRAAEEVFLGEDKITTGGGNDFEKAEELARKMVSEWGMGKFGPAIFFKSAPGFYRERQISEQTAAKIDEEVMKILSDSLDKAKNIILEKKEVVAKLAELLMEKMVLDAKEITEVLKNHKIQGELNRVGGGLSPSVPSSNRTCGFPAYGSPTGLRKIAGAFLLSSPRTHALLFIPLAVFFKECRRS